MSSDFVNRWDSLLLKPSICIISNFVLHNCIKNGRIPSKKKSIIHYPWCNGFHQSESSSKQVQHWDPPTPMKHMNAYFARNVNYVVSIQYIQSTILYECFFSPSHVIWLSFTMGLQFFASLNPLSAQSCIFVFLPNIQILLCFMLRFVAYSTLTRFMYLFIYFL